MGHGMAFSRRAMPSCGSNLAVTGSRRTSPTGVQSRFRSVRFRSLHPRLSSVSSVATRTDRAGDDHLSRVRPRQHGDDAHGRLPVLLHMQGVRHNAASATGRLLRVLLLRRTALSA